MTRKSRPAKAKSSSSRKVVMPSDPNRKRRSIHGASAVTGAAHPVEQHAIISALCHSLERANIQLQACRELSIQATKRKVQLVMGLQRLMAAQTADISGQRLVKSSDIATLIS